MKRLGEAVNNAVLLRVTLIKPLAAGFPNAI